MSIGLLTLDGSVEDVSAPAAGSTSTGERCTCGAAVQQVRNAAGWPVLLELEPHPAGNVVPGRDERGRVVAHVLTEAAAASSSQRRWRAHLSVCPAAVSAPASRAHPRGLVLSNVRCPLCGERLPVVLLRLAEETHPCCPAPAGPRPLSQGTR